MPLTFDCPTCGMGLQADDEMAGRKMRCPGCEMVFRVPESAAPQPRPERPAHDPDRPRYDDDGYDEEPDPRPRRRRRPPPPAGRSPLFIIAVILGVLVVGSCACCGGGYLLLPSENWRRYESPDGYFAVDLPARVKRDMHIPGLKPEPGQHVEGAMLWKRGECYVVLYVDIPPAGERMANADAVLDMAVTEIRNDPECRKIDVERVQVTGFPAREIKYTYSDGGVYSGLLVVANRHFYVVLAGGRFARSDNANVRRFLDSFEVTEAQPDGAPAKARPGRRRK